MIVYFTSILLRNILSPSAFRDIVVRSQYSAMAMKVEAARLMVHTAAARARRGEPTLSFISSAAKCFASDVAMEVTTNAVQLLGGAGYTVDFPVERKMRDAKITQIYEGTNQIQRVVMARALLA
jgi:alkylation response protein AidB-like acyl-CoA dehydrogenase